MNTKLKYKENKLRKSNIFSFRKIKREWWQHRNLRLIVENFPEQKINPQFKQIKLILCRNIKINFYQVTSE